MPKIP
jgi:hypothetical protein